MDERRPHRPDGEWGKGRKAKSGILYALGAFGFWGRVPIYFKALAHVPAMEVLAHRVFWSAPVTGALLILSGRWGNLPATLRQPRALPTLFVSSSLVLVNWFTFIFAVEKGRILEASLGYYINPLVNVLLGTLFLGENLRRTQVVAVLLAAAGTVNLLLATKLVPWVAMVLALSFGLYGFVRKKLSVDPLEGLFIETAIMAPFALLYMVWLASKAEICFGLVDTLTTILLASAGIVTALPLFWFIRAAKALTLSALGIVQYVAPTCQFLLGVFAYGEPLSWHHLVTFGCIWAGIALFTFEAWREVTRPRK